MGPFPFLGDVAGACWNAQALFARRRRRHVDKDMYVRRLLRHRDFVSISEAHCLEGAAAAWSCPSDCQAWFSPGTSRRAGVGIIVKKQFLGQFDAAPPNWIETVPGRAAVLQLRGNAGALDLHVVYFATGSDGMVVPRGAAIPAGVDEDARRQRRQMRTALAGRMAPASEALSIVMGDFNWVARREDRVSKATGDATGQTDAAEERHAEEVLYQPHGLYELRQEEPTHENAACRSRLDRAYWNADVAGQLDRSLLCSALEWVPHLSAHRALAFSRRASSRHLCDSAPIRADVIDHPLWPARVAAELHESRARQEGDMATFALTDLQLLKQAMRTVSDRMQREKQQAPRQADQDDYVGHTMRFIRAAERGSGGSDAVWMECDIDC